MEDQSPKNDQPGKLSPLPNPNHKDPKSLIEPLAPIAPKLSHTPTAKAEPSSTWEKSYAQLNQLRKRARGRLNKPMLLALLVISVALIWLTTNQLRSRTVPKKEDSGYNNQNLSNDELNRLSSKTKAADPSQILTVNSNAIFAGNVVANQDLTLRGKLNLSGPLNLSALNVSGTSSFQGGLGVSNAINLQGSLTVTGNGSFGGDVSANTITARKSFNSGTLTIGGHIVTSGNPPSSTPGPGAGGGSTKVFGNDSAGTIVINTGNSPAPGNLITVTFRTSYTNNPHITITAVGPEAAKLQPYISRFLTFFTIGTGTAPAANSEYVFDYTVIQ